MKNDIPKSELTSQHRADDSTKYSSYNISWCSFFQTQIKTAKKKFIPNM